MASRLGRFKCLLKHHGHGTYSDSFLESHIHKNENSKLRKAVSQTCQSTQRQRRFSTTTNTTTIDESERLITSDKHLVQGTEFHYEQTGRGKHTVLLLPGALAVEDINTWSLKMRQPFIEMYGEEYFKKQWKAWNQAIQNYYVQRNGDICIGSLPNIRCPTLIVNGLLDPLVPQEHPVFLQKHIPNCRTIEWPDGKHNLHLRYPQQFNAMAEEFLDAEIPIKV